jgi:membrane associated rhomboid family serine protease
LAVGEKLKENIQITLIALGVIWAVFGLDILISQSLTTMKLYRFLGIIPWEVGRLWRILTAPFIHASLGHILSNSIPLVILLFMALTFSRRLTARALVAIVILGGLVVWFLGRTGVHGGASGVIFGLIGFLLGVGVFRMSWRSLLVALVVLVFYGGAIISAVIPRPGISWMGHLGGFGAGVFVAWLTRSGDRN